MKTPEFIKVVPFLALLTACAYNVEGSQTGAQGQPNFPIEKSKIEIDLSVSDDVNHEAMVLGIMCSAHHFNVKIGDDLKHYLSLLDASGVLNDTTNPDVTISLSSSNSNLRCLYHGVGSGSCIGTVVLKGNIHGKSTKKNSFTIEHTSKEKSSACEGAINSLELANQSISQKLLDKVNKTH